jgi:two-component SAPR family response regulator
MTGQQAPLAGRRVLVVEDRYIMASELADHVRKLGGEVIGPSPNVAGALKLCTDIRVDLGLLDVCLGSETVYPLAQILKDRQVPVVFLTGYDEGVIPTEWRDEPRLQKPIQFNSLSDTIARTLAGGRTPHAAGSA